MSIVEKFKSWLREKVRPQYRTMIVEEDIPDHPKNKILYIITEDEKPWSAAMVCPCGCHSVIHLNLLPDERPVWHLTHHLDDTVSLSPSIWRKKGCESHFWLREGRVYWTPDQLQPLYWEIWLFLKRS